MSDAIPLPPADLPKHLRYIARPRLRRAFNTVLDARALLGASERTLTVSTECSADAVTLNLAIDLAEGRIRESFHARRSTDDRLRAQTLTRVITDHTDAVIREERARLDDRVIGLPPATYPEVMLPFMLGWFPHDGRRRSLFAWINDRFVARVYVESGKRTRIDLNGNRIDALECVMYPDLNDWVPLGATLSQLAKPFLPKYRMWMQPHPPFALMRFEGPYGPPGAPELVLELCDD